MIRHPTPATATFVGAAGNKLVADVFGDSGSPVLLQIGVEIHCAGLAECHAWLAIGHARPAGVAS
jgi:hypothetical protein